MTDVSKKRFGPFLIDTAERSLWRDGQAVPLTPKAFDVLAALIEEPGRLVSKDELLRSVWPDTFVEESNLAYNVFAVRKALGDTAGHAQYVETVPKRGYRFIAAVTPAPPIEAKAAEPSAATSGAGNASRSDAPASLPSFSHRWSLATLIPVLGVVWYFAAPPWRLPVEGEPARALPLTSLAGVVRSPSLSPDGAYVVFTWTGPAQDNPDLYVQQIGAGSPLRLTTDPSNDYSPAWSPDGRMIAFLRREPNSQSSEVRLVAPLGGSERKIADIQPLLPSYRPRSLAWCPDSACVVVTDSAGDDKADALFAIAIDGGRKWQLTDPKSQATDVDPSMAPDGGSLVFRRDTTPFSGAFYRLSLRSGTMPNGDAVQLTPTLSAGKAAWTPDSRFILFSSRGALWKLDAIAGGSPSRLPFVGQDGVSPVVSRTAAGRRRLVYVRSYSDGNVWRVDTAPGTSSPATPVRAIASTRADLIPNLSPDGRRLAFVSDRSGDLQIWVADADGGNPFQLTAQDFRSAPGYPRWSPDGLTIAFHGDPRGRPELIVAPVRGGGPKSLSEALANAGFPSFSRDGKWVYFAFLEAGESRIWKMPSAGGAAVRVTDNPGTLAIEGVDGRDLYYVAAVDRPSALWRLPLDGGSPAKVLDGVVFGSFDVTQDGIYYIDRMTGEAGAFIADRPGGETRLRYFDFATRRTTTVAGDLGTVNSGLSASPDGRTVFFSRVDASADELMLVDDFQ